MPRKRFPSWDPRGWPEAQLDPPTQPLRLPNQQARVRSAIDPLDVFAALTLPLDAPDPDGLTPLFDSAWASSGLSGRHARTPTGEVPAMSKHADFDDDGVLDHLQGAGEPEVWDSGLPTGVPDTGDLIDPAAPDPTPDEITHPDHHDYVEPYTGEN